MKAKIRKLSVRLTDEQKAQYLKNEDWNYHSENLLLLAEVSGERRLIDLAKTLIKKRDQMGGIYPVMRPLRDFLSEKLRIAK